MLDHYEIHHSPSVVRKEVTVHEHRAPTDEALRLLKEMQDKARESLVTYPMNFSGLACTLHLMNNPVDVLNDMQAVLTYTLNGDRKNVKVEFSWYDTAEYRINKLRDALAASLAANMLRDAIDADRNLAPMLLGNRV